MTPHVPLLFFFSARKPRGRYHHSTNKTSGLLANASTHSHAFSLQTHMSTATIRDAQRERKKKTRKNKKKSCALSLLHFFVDSFRSRVLWFAFRLSFRSEDKEGKRRGEREEGLTVGEASLFSFSVGGPGLHGGRDGCSLCLVEFTFLVCMCVGVCVRARPTFEASYMCRCITRVCDQRHLLGGRCDPTHTHHNSSRSPPRGHAHPTSTRGCTKENNTA